MSNGFPSTFRLFYVSLPAQTQTMLRIVFSVFLFCIIALSAASDDRGDLQHWRAGKVVSPDAIKHYGGVDLCFNAIPLSDSLFMRIQGLSYKAGCTIPREDLRYIQVLHYNIKGDILLGEMICHKRIAADLVSIFHKLFDVRYPIERMVLIDEYEADDERSMLANNSSAFNFRYVSGTRKLSAHSKGLAVDINPRYNPYIRRNRKGETLCSPEGSRLYANRSADFPYKIVSGDACHREFTKHGFTWGGNWKYSKDYQHFEKRE